MQCKPTSRNASYKPSPRKMLELPVCSKWKLYSSIYSSSGETTLIIERIMQLRKEKKKYCPCTYKICRLVFKDVSKALKRQDLKV